MPEVVNLRGHHLLCILTHGGTCSTGGGEEYSPEFTENLRAQIDRINNGAAINIVSGPDDVCAALLREATNTCAHARICTRGTVVRTHDSLALKDVARELQSPPLEAGDTFRLGKGEIARLRQAFAAGTLRDGCKGCPWHAACSEVAGKNFSGARLRPDAVPSPSSRLPRQSYGRFSSDP